MVKLVVFSVLFAFFLMGFLRLHAASSTSFKPETSLQAKRSCPYTVIIKTSCSSTTFTRDQISLAYGDAFGNEVIRSWSCDELNLNWSFYRFNLVNAQVYAKRLDNPASRTFERCSSDKLEINGPCTRNICYLNLLRNGSDGWKPEFVKIYGPHANTVSFNFNTFLPNRVWFGHNLCHGVSAPWNILSSNQTSMYVSAPWSAL